MKLNKEARIKAKEAGEMLYEGSQCKICEGTKRYVSNNGCYACMQKRNQSKKKPGKQYIAAQPQSNGRAPTTEENRIKRNLVLDMLGHPKLSRY